MKPKAAVENELPGGALEAPKGIASNAWRYGLALLLVIVMFGAIRFRLRDMPLERDEGEYAYAGQLLLQGIPPYQLAYNMKLPGTYAAYSLILATFGQTPRGIHCGLIVINAAVTVLVFFLTRRLWGHPAAVVASAAHAVLSTSDSVLGFAAHATHFVALPALGGLLLLLRAIERRRTGLFFWSGVLLGLAPVMKQPGVFFLLLAAWYFIKSQWKSSREWRDFGSAGGALILGSILPVALTCLILFRAGVWTQFCFWAFQYAREYATALGIRAGVHQFLWAAPRVVWPSIFVWAIAAVGLLWLFWSTQSGHFDFAAGLLVFSFLAVCPGFYFRSHYFILMLPAVAVLAGIGVSGATQQIRARGGTALTACLPACLFVLALLHSMLQQREVYFRIDPVAACRKAYGGNPFPEAVRVAEYIRVHASPEARIAVLGSEPEIYFYSARHSATGYIYTYGMMEAQKFARKMQKEMAAEIEAAHPEYVVVVNVPMSWLSSPNSPQDLFSWAGHYLQAHELVGVVDILEKSEYRWDGAAKTYHPRSPYTMYVFKRTGA